MSGIAMPNAEQVGELPDDLRAPLYSLKADIVYLFDQVSADRSLLPMMTDSAANRLSQIEEAAYRLNAQVTAQAAEIERLRERLEITELHERELRPFADDYVRERNKAAALESSLAAVKAERDAMRAAACVDKQTAQILLSLLNPLHGALDLQTYDERYKQGFDAPKDAEYEVTVTAQMERDIQQAVVILERRLSDAALSTDAQEG